MKKNAIIIFIALLFLNLTAIAETSPVKLEENKSSIKEQSTEEDMFAPVDLDLTDYTFLNKKNKRFKLSAEKEAKTTYVKNTNQ